MIVRIMRQSVGNMLVILDYGPAETSVVAEGLIVNPSRDVQILPNMSVGFTLYQSSISDRWISGWRGRLLPLPNSLDHRGSLEEQISWNMGVRPELAVECLSRFLKGIYNYNREFLDDINRFLVKSRQATLTFDRPYYAPMMRSALRDFIAAAAKNSEFKDDVLSRIGRLIDSEHIEDVPDADQYKFISLDVFKQVCQVYKSNSANQYINILLYEACIFLGPNEAEGVAFVRSLP